MLKDIYVKGYGLIYGAYVCNGLNISEQDGLIHRGW